MSAVPLPIEPPEPSMPRHFTVTGFVSVGGRTALHWHPRLDRWLPPGGHVEPDEDPVEAVLREVREETGLDVEVIAEMPFAYDFPPQLPAPAAIAVYDIPRDGSLAGPHQHIDLIYFTRPLTPTPVLPADDHRWAWVDEATLQHRPAFFEERGRRAEVAEDVRELALAAIAAARGHSGL
ncbi:MAG: NUDIX domain-containing protein [Dehalococcoidia bacterium]